MIHNTALTLLSSKLSNGPGGSSRQRKSLTARLSKEKKKNSWGTNKFTKDSREQKLFRSYGVLSKLVLLISKKMSKMAYMFSHNKIQI